MTRHARTITPPDAKHFGFRDKAAQRAYIANHIAYPRGLGAPESQGIIDAQAEAIDKMVSDFWAAVTPDEAFAAAELTEEQAEAWTASQPCFAHLTVEAVMDNDRLRVLAARHGMGMQ